MASNPALRPTYTRDQVHQIYARIQLADIHRHEPGQESRTVAQHASRGLDYLRALQTAVLISIPFENLELHYSPHKVISLDPEVIFDKMITQGRGRGGYCMENNVFFGTLLRTLGFRVTSAAARTNHLFSRVGDAPPIYRFQSWGHMINIVTLQADRYLVDVGFGPGGPVKPVLLKDGATAMNIAPNLAFRVRWGPIPETEDQDLKLWIYERRNAADEDEEQFRACYCFAEGLEWLPGDFDAINFRTSRAASCSMTWQIICARFIVDDGADDDDREEGSREIVGEIVLHKDAVYKRVRGVKEELATLKTERDRIEAMEKFLGVTLSKAQMGGIRGLVSALQM